jgi:UDP-N-acetylmuramate--alanine ligase
MFGKTNHIHFIGIGGIGMSGMAELLFKLGFKITGSDQINSERTESLRKIGIDIFIGHKKENIKQSDVVVYSSAVNLSNPEIKNALKVKIPVIRRAEMLAELIKLKRISIAIAGTHGKTTSSSMLGSILLSASCDPTMVIGGIVNKFQSNSISGDGEIIVVEADEFDRSFLTLHPTMGVITNLDLEHLDCYENLEDLQTAFTQFANAIPFYGKIAIGIDNINTKNIINNINRPVTTFGLNKNAQVRAINLHFSNNKSSFTLVYDNELKGDLEINLPGEHNIKNALAAITIALQLDISFNDIKKGLNQYSGVRRRFDIKYKTSNEIMIVDDYAHHPTEVLATLKAARSGWNKRLIAIFQPHLFSRTRDFYKEFAKALLQSDILIITDIYEAREKPIKGITSEIIYNESKKLGHKNIELIKNQLDIPNRLKEISKENDLIITMGAGNIWRQCENIYKAIQL